MGESSGRSGRALGICSGGLLLYITIFVMVDAGVVSGLIVGTLSWYVWGVILKAVAFMKGNDDGYTFYVGSDDSEDSAGPDDPQLPARMPASREVVQGNSSRNVHESVGRIIGADARRRVALAQVLGGGAPAPRRTEAERTEDREFADFLRSTPF